MTYRTTDGELQEVEGPGIGVANEPSTRVAMQLAEESGKRVDELTPLAETVDPEALDDIFGKSGVRDARVTFTHEGYTVTVTGHGDVTVEPAGGE